MSLCEQVHSFKGLIKTERREVVVMVMVRGEGEGAVFNLLKEYMLNAQIMVKSSSPCPLIFIIVQRQYIT